MRGRDGSVLIDLGDREKTLITRPLTSLPISTTDENDTLYNLYPTRLNEPPIITSGIIEASTPKIYSIQAVEPTRNALYINNDQTIRVATGKTITLRVVAEQPSILNVENGIPQIIPTGTGLTYVWRKDGVVISGTLNRQSTQPGYIINNNELTISNPDTTFSGIYTCDISNDISTTSAEDLEFEFIDVKNNPLFKLNHVVNPIAVNGLDGWTTTIGSTQVQEFSSLPTSEFKLIEKTDIFGYTTDMLAPYPTDLDAFYNDITNYKPINIIESGRYFTRSKINYYVNGEVITVSMYQDIDLIDLQEYIQGSIHGVRGLSANFSCYIGNAVSRFLHNQSFITPNNRRDRRKYNFSQSRLSLANMELAGLPEINESVQVILEQYDKETLVPTTTRNENGRVVTVPRIILQDPWTVAKNAVTNSDRFLKTNEMANYLYGPNDTARYTSGQFIQHNEAAIIRLNFNTTKIRIKINFSISDVRLVDLDTIFTENTDEIYDIISWQKPYSRNVATGNVQDNGNFIYYQLSQRLRNASRPTQGYIPKNGISRALVTGVNFNVSPILDDGSRSNILNESGIAAPPVSITSLAVQL